MPSWRLTRSRPSSGVRCLVRRRLTPCQDPQMSCSVCESVCENCTHPPWLAVHCNGNRWGYSRMGSGASIVCRFAGSRTRSTGFVAWPELWHTFIDCIDLSARFVHTCSPSRPLTYFLSCTNNTARCPTHILLEGTACRDLIVWLLRRVRQSLPHGRGKVIECCAVD